MPHFKKPNPTGPLPQSMSGKDPKQAAAIAYSVAKKEGKDKPDMVSRKDKSSPSLFDALSTPKKPK